MAEQLRDRGLRVGLITNDQSYGLVDTKMLSAHGFAVEEITGGCFSCRFNSVVDAAEKLSEETTPDFFIAEPVGSCTDLKATVDYPLRRIYGDQYAIAPLSVLVDPIRAARVLGLETGKSFSEKVIYIYGKQLEEAEIIVINKVDLLSPDQLETLKRALASRYPQAHVQVISARAGLGMEEWISRIIDRAPRTTGAMEVDYVEYADGEALLGWLNATVELQAATPFDGNALLLELAGQIQSRLKAQSAEVAHLKMTLTPGESGNDLAVANLVTGDGAAELSHRLQEELESGQLILNLRAEADPDLLRQTVLAVIGEIGRQAGIEAHVAHLEHFRPGKPTPTHRLAGI
jgi:G3E family GTPase